MRTSLTTIAKTQGFNALLSGRPVRSGLHTDIQVGPVIAESISEREMLTAEIIAAAIKNPIEGYEMATSYDGAWWFALGCAIKHYFKLV